MTAGITSARAYIVFCLVVHHVFCFCVMSQVYDIPPKHYWTGQTNIVATVSAYELITNLPTGERVPSYSKNIDNLCTNYSAIIFYVIAPTTYAGKFFRLNAIPAELGAGSLPPAYHTGKLYYFSFLDMPESSAFGVNFWFSINRDDLFSVPNEKSRLNVGKITGNIYYPSCKEAENALIALDNQRIKLEEEINSLSCKLEKLKLLNGSNVNIDMQLKKLKGKVLDLKMESLPSNEYKQKEVRMQIENLKQIENNSADQKSSRDEKSK